MHIESKLSGVLVGSIRLFLHTMLGDVQVGLAKNMILDTGMNLLSRALVGDVRVNGMYFLFDNNGPGTYPEFMPSTPLSHFHTTLSTGYLGFVRSPLVSDGSVQYSDGVAVSTYTAVTGSQVAIADTDNALTDGTSMFYGAALGYIHPTDMTQDMLLSVVRFSDVSSLADGVILKTAGSSIGVRWAIQAGQSA